MSSAHITRHVLRRLVMASLVVPLVVALVGWERPVLARQDGGSSHTGDVFGDLIHIKRDPLTGQPILQKREVLLPEDVVGWAYCPIPVDVSGAEIPFLPDSCDPDPTYEAALIPLDYFGRLSGGRTREQNLRMHFDETIASIKLADLVTLEETGRLRLGTDCTAGVCASWKTVDSPMENMSLYRRLMKYGHLQTDPLEEDTSPGGDPEEGTVYHPALDASDWVKFTGPVAELLPAESSSACFAGMVFDPTCALPQALTEADLFLSGAFLAAAGDKTGRITPDLVQYINRILQIPVETPQSAATLNTLPALIRDENGVIAPAAPGLPAPADERFVDFAPANYLRADWYATSVLVLQPSGGMFVPTMVNLLEWLVYVNGPMAAPAMNLPGFVAGATDAVRVIEFVHEYAIPADLWSGPAATTTTVAPRLVTYRTTDQPVGLTAAVTSQSQTPVTGTITFSVRTAASAPVGLPVTVPVAAGAASATWVLPGGTEPQVLTVAALFEPTGAFASSLGFGTLTIAPAPTGNVIDDGSFDEGTGDWMQYASPNPGDIVTQVTDGVLEFYWVPPPPGTVGQATVFQQTGLALPPYAPLTAEFALGNSSTVRKRISVVLTDADFSDRMVCTFWLPPLSPLRNYRMLTHTTRAWADTAIYFYAATAGYDGGYYQIDDVALYPDPTGPTSATLCVDPYAPTAPGGADGPELLLNGTFETGLSPWLLFGQITAQVTAGVLELLRTDGDPVGVVLQQTTQAASPLQIVTAQFDLGNSSAVRKRVTVTLHDADFSDLAACMFWLEPGQPLATHVMRTYATDAWSDATVSIYPGTIDAEPWTLVDNVSLRFTPATPIVGTECLEPVPLDPLVSVAGPANSRPGAGPGFVAREPASDLDTEAGTWAFEGATAGTQIGWLTDALDLRFLNAARLRFESSLEVVDATATVEVSDDGVVWHPLAEIPPMPGWATLEVDLGAFLGRIVFVRFVFDAPIAPPAGALPDRWTIRGLEVVGGHKR